jgi:pimeloyl-ACP methyl ester carboxylesterase
VWAAGWEETLRCGHEPVTGTYYEVLGAGYGAPAVLMIHGGGATGACFRADLEGRPGWADLLATRGHTVWVSDWPGCGRSGNRVLTDIEYDDVVEGHRRLLRDVIGEPVVIVCHSMGGAVAWQLVEHEPDLVAGVVSVAAAFPGNLGSRSEILSEEGSVTTVRFVDSGAVFVVDRSRGYLYEDEYIFRQGIATSRHFPLALVDRMRAGLVPLPPKMLLQRMGVLPGLPSVDDPSGFQGLGVRLVAGSEDPAHTLSIERATSELLSGWGAHAEVVWLADLGIDGNGHFLFFEDNADDVLGVVAEQIGAVSTRFGPLARG